MHGGCLASGGPSGEVVCYQSCERAVCFGLVISYYIIIVITTNYNNYYYYDYNSNNNYYY